MRTVFISSRLSSSLRWPSYWFSITNPPELKALTPPKLWDVAGVVWLLSLKPRPNRPCWPRPSTTSGLPCPDFPRPCPSFHPEVSKSRRPIPRVCFSNWPCCRKGCWGWGRHRRRRCLTDTNFSFFSRTSFLFYFLLALHYSVKFIFFCNLLLKNLLATVLAPLEGTLD